eukprot:TRINITY_DN2016_c0_g1_i2.p1 TRINITY_DN2016_c0_g1~~TRINITY_DN2016_c0_g1_i2.p1  ORF type:complete len:1578 (+),score=122.56 TRINITY_DN2016_c0_g1_i2:196-4734(+)
MKNTVSTSNGVFSQDIACEPLDPDPGELEIYTELYGTSSIAEAEQKIKSLVKTQGECGKQIEEGEIAWSCRDCGADLTCIICQECYENSNHEGHREYIRRDIIGGKCDCGDPESWAISGSCALHAGGFTDETKVPPELLPEPLRLRAIRVLDWLLKTLNSHCLKLEAALDNSGEAILCEVANFQQRITVLSRILSHLSKLSPIFLHMIAVRLRQHFIYAFTKHRCHQRTFDTPEEKTVFTTFCEKAEAGPEGTHPCTCTFLENYMRVLFSFPEPLRIFFNEELFYTLMRNRKLKYFMGISYFANYSSIIPYTFNDTTLANISVQFVSYDDVVEKVLGNKCYLKEIFVQLQRILEDLRLYTRLNCQIPRSLVYQTVFLCADLKHLLKEKYKKIYQSCLLQFIECLGIMQSINFIKATKDYAVKRIECLFEKYFVHMLSAVDLSDSTLCSQIVKAFDSAHSLSHHSTMQRHSIILHRCLSIFLTSYLVTNYWLLDLTEPKTTIITLISKLWGAVSENEEIAKKWLPELLQAIGHFVTTGADDLSFSEYGTNQKTCAVDFSLAVILLLMLPPQEDILEWILKEMHPNRKEWIDSAFTKKEIEPSSPRLIMEMSLYTICCWISNDIMYYHLLAYLYNCLLFPQPPIENTKSVANSYFQYAVSRLIVLLYLPKSSSSGGLPHSVIQNGFPRPLKDLNKIEKALEQLTTPYEDTNDHVIKFRLLDGSLRLFDPFFFFCASFIKTSDYAIACMRKIQDPAKFDFLLGELMKPSEISSQNASGAPFVPFKNLFREFLANSGIVRRMIKLVKETEGMTPWLINCALKIMIGCSPYEKDPKVVAEAWKVLGENIGRIIFEDSGTYSDGILTAYQKLINTKINEKIDLPSGQFLELKQQKSEETKAKIREIQSKVKAEFEARILAFKNKNKVILRHSKENYGKDCLTCAYCREEVSIDKYSVEPFGSIVYVQKSTAYGHHLNQVLKNVLGTAYKEEYRFKNVVGRSQGAVLNNCGHHIHIKCFAHMLSNPPENIVYHIDGESYPGNFLCPICQGCANTLVPPAEIVATNKTAAKYVKDYTLLRIRNTIYPKEEKVDTDFLMTCKCVSYHLNLISLNNVEDFVMKKDVLVALVYTLKQSILEEEYYDEMQAIMGTLKRVLRFLIKGRYRLFKADLTLVFSMLIIAAKIMETPECEAKLYEELRDKITLIVKLAIMQIILRLLYSEVGPTANHETLSKAFKGSGGLNWLKDFKAIEELLVPFLKKLFCLKTILWPTPGKDSQTEMLKASWLDNKNSLDFYTQGLDLEEDIKSPSMLDAPKVKKPVYLPLPHVNTHWMKKAWTSLSRHFYKESLEGIPPIIPKNLILFDTACTPFSMVPLPELFTELQKVYARKVCKRCGKTEADSAACLLCGELLCVARPCCSIKGHGELTVHSKICPGGCGMYLRLINNKVILVDKGHACNYPSPYVNKYGESVDVQKDPDCGPLRLESRIIEELKTMYLTHRVAKEVRVTSLKAFIKFKPFYL